MVIAHKFFLTKQSFRSFLELEAKMTPGSAKNLANAVWNNIQPKRQVGNLAQFLERNVPYQIPAKSFENFLTGTEQIGDINSYRSIVKRIEGLYIQLRRHATNGNLVIEYLALQNALFGYLSFKFDIGVRVFQGKFKLGGQHVFFHSSEENPYSEINGIVEIRDPPASPYPVQILGLDDFRQEIVTCTAITAKITNRVKSHVDFLGKLPREANSDDLEIKSHFPKTINLAKIVTNTFSARQTLMG
jgi:hypothetical protein